MNYEASFPHSRFHLSSVRRRAALTTGVIASAIGLATFATPTPVHACGGTFCEQPTGPVSMPVNQTGETIVFRLHDGRVEAHVQIAYNGDPQTFAWLVPVPKIPDVAPSSDRLFVNLLTSTVPTYAMDFQPSGLCGVPNTGSMACGSFAAEDLAAGDDGSEWEPDPPEDPGNPEVLKRGVAGAFEYVVLQGDSVDEITNWLDYAGYQQDEDAPPILQEYIDENFLFLAIKLRSGAGVDEIHPIAFDYEGDEPCLPIRLTRIAAEEDMGIRAFFLGEHRAAPMNYAHVVLNHIAVTWLPALGADYEDVVTLAVDQTEGGMGFVTEYAGASSIVSRDGIRLPTWNVDAFASIEGAELGAQLGDELIAQGLLACGGGVCQWQHPLIEGIIDDYVTVPDGVDENEFWACTSCFAEQLDPSNWNGAAFAQAVDERIVQPGEHANEMLDSAPVLTRMFTTMSPHEMLKDPMFWENPDLPNVDATINSTRLGNCAGPDWIAFDDGRQMALSDDFGWPSVPDLPVLERIERVPAVGAPMVEIDRSAEIDAALEAWNADFEFSTEGGDGGPDDDRPGFGCIALGVDAGAWYMFGIFAMAGWTRRRRRR